MHHKVAIIDGMIVITGSYNWSSSAEDVNDENLIILKDREIALSYEKEFQRVWKEAFGG
ncbi:MAG: phospholipase D-like domain-containing protein [Nitrososphaerales archaeon]